MDASSLILLILLMAVSNFVTRAAPFVLLGNRKLPKPMAHWCQQVAVPVLASMVACEIFYSGGRLDLSSMNPQLAAGLPCFFVAYQTKSLGTTVLFGVGMLALVRYIG